MNWEFYAKKAADKKPHLMSETKNIDDDNREVVAESKNFRSKWGFEPSETWNLDRTIAAFILPRLAYFRDNIVGIPNYCCKYNNEFHLLNEEEAIRTWERDLDKMILAFVLILNDEFIKRPEAQENQIKEGLRLFAEHFEDLWS